MRTLLAVALAACAAFAAEDAWVKVKALKSGAEIRIVKRGSAQPLVAKFDELRDDLLVVVLKNEQSAIPLDQIDRVEARPDRGSRVVKETSTKEESPTDAHRLPPGMAGGSVVPHKSTSSSLSVTSKPDFEVVYRRTPSAATKQAK